uniref:Nose resistant to fluoxetine protein 6 n=1 Tax=Aceria tosichella TaxID=561515 RepID=A0A6G1SLV5_9ACAR
MSQRNSTPHFLFKVLTLATTITLPLCLLTITPSTHATSKFQECSNNHNASQLIDRQSSFLDERNTGGLTLQNGQNNGNGPVNDSGLLSAPIIHKTQPELVHDEREKNLIINEKRTRDVNMWRLDFIEEEADGFELKVLDDTIDERMANLISTMLSLKAIGTDFFTFNSGSPDQDRKNMESVAGPQVDELKCHRHLKGMVSLLDDMNERLVKKRSNQSIPLRLEEKHHRLARVLDSYGRYESGHLSGRTHSIGQYDQCIHTDLLLANESSKSPSSNQLERVRSRYCWARLKMDKHLHPSLKARPKESFEPDGIMVAICLPQSCHSKTFSRNKPLIQRLVDSQFRLPRSIYTDESMEVNSVYCLIDQESKYASLPFSGKLAVISLVSWLMLTIYATAVYNPQSTAAGRNKLFSSVMDCLNLRKSIQDLVVDNESSMSSAELEKLKLQERNRTVELNVLNPVKTFGSAFVVMGHSLVVHAAVNQNGLMAYHMAMSDPQVLLIVVGTFIVDTFFVITGVLIGFIAMKRANSSSRSSTKLEKAVNEQELVTNEEKQHTSSRTTTTSQMKLFAKHWLMFAINRHLLLVPMLFLVFWFKKSVFIHYFADKPLWDAGFNKDTLLGACKQESWLSPFTLRAAFMPLNKQCLPQTWSVSTDLFFSLTIPPVVMIMPRKPRLAFAIGVVMTLISTLWSAHAYFSISSQELETLNDITTEGLILMFGSIHHLYTYPQFRFCSVLIGLLAGYHLYRFGQKPAEQRKWPDWIKKATRHCFICLLFIIVGFCMMPKLKHLITPYQKLVFANIYTTFRIIWTSCNALLFLRMASDWQHNYLMQMFAGRLWQSTAKLSYGILLIHVDVLFYVKSSYTTTNYFTKHALLTDFSAAYFYCIPLAAFLYVVYENPINKLVKRHVLPSIESMM